MHIHLYSICTCIHVCVFSCSIFLSSLYIYTYMYMYTIPLYTCIYIHVHICKHYVHQNRKIQVLMYTCTLECVSVTTMYTLQETNMIHTAVLETVIFLVFCISGSESHLRQLIFLRKSDWVCCVVVFFLSSLIKTCIGTTI